MLIKPHLYMTKSWECFGLIGLITGGDVIKTVKSVSVIKRIISLLCAGVFLFLLISVPDFRDIPVNEMGRRGSQPRFIKLNFKSNG